MSTNKVDWAREVATAISAMKEEGAKAYTYLKQEAPEVGAEYVRWKMAESSILASVCVVGAVLLAVAAEKLRRAGTRHTPEYGGDNGYYIISAITFIASAVVFVHSDLWAIDATKCLVAPRIVIIEGIKEVVR
jgi:hypothetical protein